MVYLLKMVIFHSYVSLPEGNDSNLDPPWLAQLPPLNLGVQFNAAISRGFFLENPQLFPEK